MLKLHKFTVIVVAGIADPGLGADLTEAGYSLHNLISSLSLHFSTHTFDSAKSNFFQHPINDGYYWSQLVVAPLQILR